METQQFQMNFSAWLSSRETAISSAFATFAALRPDEIILIIKPQLISTSRSREHLIINAQIARTNLLAGVLEDLSEDPNSKAPKENGALFHMSAVLQEIADGKKGGRTSLLRDRLLAYYNNKPGFTRSDFIMTTDQRRGVFHRCVMLLFSWYVDVLKAGSKQKIRKSKQQSINVPSANALFDSWHARWAKYAIAAATTVTFGRDTGRTLGESGKRNVRWLRNRLISEDVAKQTLKHVEVLLQPTLYKKSELLAAERALHPWKRDRPYTARPPRRRQRARASRLLQLHNDQSGHPRKLTSCSRQEWEELRLEMQEQLRYAPQFKAIQNAVERFLAGAPERFPQVKRILSEEERRLLEQQRERLLTKFTMPVDAKGDGNAEQLVVREQKLTTSLLKVDGKLLPGKLLPLPFSHNMRPPEYRGSAVVQDKKTGQWLLAVEMEGAKPPKLDGNLIFANAPYTTFAPPATRNMLLFPLQHGYEYHGTILDAARDRALLAQQAAYASQQEQTLLLEDCFPKDAPIGPVEISSARNERGWTVLYAHIPVHVSVPPCSKIPTTVMGVHLDNDWCSYVIVSLKEHILPDGRVAKPGEIVKMGEIVPPPGMDPFQSAKPYNTNFVFNIVARIVDVANHYNAYIGLEDTLWKKRKTDTSPKRNRQVMRFPAAIIAAELERKVFIRGLIKPRNTGNISPVNDCGGCGTRLKKGNKRLSIRPVKRCPNCETPSLVTGKYGERYYCSGCKYTWQRQESWFTCEACAFRCSQRHNVALVVARRTLEQLLEHHIRYLAWLAKNERS